MSLQTDRPSVADLTAFQRDILWALANDGPMYGMAIKRAIEEYYDERINHGRLYPNLDDLADRGFIEISKRDKRTNDYQLTETARRALSTRQSFQEGSIDELAH